MTSEDDPSIPYKKPYEGDIKKSLLYQKRIQDGKTINILCKNTK